MYGGASSALSLCKMIVTSRVKHRVKTAYLGQKESKLNVLAIKAKAIQNKAQAYLHVPEKHYPLLILYLLSRAHHFCLLRISSIGYPLPLGPVSFLYLLLFCNFKKKTLYLPGSLFPPFLISQG